MMIKALSVLFLIAAVEVLHGILRAKFLAPRVGGLRSRQLGVFTGSLLILGIAKMTFEWIDPSSISDAFTIGLIWFIGMLVFEMWIGHYFFKFS